MNKTHALMMGGFIVLVGVAISYAFSTYVHGQASVFQGNGGQSVGAGNDLGSSIQGLTQGIINRANEGVSNTMQNLQNQVTPQLAPNASSYDCIVVIMHFGKASGAMTCGQEGGTTSLSVNSANAPGGISSSIQSQSSNGNSATSMQNSMTGSGSSSNVITGDNP